MQVKTSEGIFIQSKLALQLSACIWWVLNWTYCLILQIKMKSLIEHSIIINTSLHLTALYAKIFNFKACTSLLHIQYYNYVRITSGNFMIVVCKHVSLRNKKTENSTTLNEVIIVWCTCLEQIKANTFINEFTEIDVYIYIYIYIWRNTIYFWRLC
jgi:hypothetical protein